MTEHRERPGRYDNALAAPTSGEGADAANARSSSPSDNLIAYGSSVSLKAKAEGTPEARHDVPGWPIGPRLLQAGDLDGSDLKQLGMRVLDWMIALSPVAFMVLGILVWRFHGTVHRTFNEDNSAHGQRLRLAIEIGVTIYPILFAGVAGRAFRIISRYRVERGSTVGMLEQLHWSTTTLGSITTQVQLRRYNWISMGIVILWCLSPIGGQATLRLLSVREKVTRSDGYVWYIPTMFNATDVLDVEFHENLLQRANNSMSYTNALYSAALTAPRHRINTATDIWGLPKIPVASHDGFELDADGWISVPEVLHWERLSRVHSSDGPRNVALASGYWSSVAMDSSLVGQQLLPMPMDDEDAWDGNAPYANLTAIVQSSHYHFDCLPTRRYSVRNVSLDGREPIRDENGADYLGAFWSGRDRLWEGTWGGTPRRGLFSDGSATTSFFLDTNVGWNDTGANVNRTIFFGSKSSIEVDEQGTSSISNISVAECRVSHRVVEAELQCQHNADSLVSDSTDLICSTSRVRNVTLDKAAQKQTPFDDEATATNIFLKWPFAGGTVPANSSSITEQYLIEPYWFYVHASVSRNHLDVGSDQLVDISLLDRVSEHYSNVEGKGFSEAFSEALTRAFNTYWQLSLQPALTMPQLPADAESFQRRARKVEARFTIYPPTWTCNFAWLAVFFLSTGVLLVLGVAATILRYRSRGPDLLGYISTLTRDNPYYPLPEGGSALDGIDRARLLRDHPIRLADVKPEKDAGYIAFTSLGKAASALSHGKEYS